MPEGDKIKELYDKVGTDVPFAEFKTDIVNDDAVKAHFFDVIKQNNPEEGKAGYDAFVEKYGLKKKDSSIPSESGAEKPTKPAPESKNPIDEKWNTDPLKILPPVESVPQPDQTIIQKKAKDLQTEFNTSGEQGAPDKDAQMKEFAQQLGEGRQVKYEKLLQNIQDDVSAKEFDLQKLDSTLKIAQPQIKAIQDQFKVNYDAYTKQLQVQLTPLVQSGKMTKEQADAQFKNAFDEVDKKTGYTKAIADFNDKVNTAKELAGKLNEQNQRAWILANANDKMRFYTKMQQTSASRNKAPFYAAAENGVADLGKLFITAVPFAAKQYMMANYIATHPGATKEERDAAFEIAGEKAEDNLTWRSEIDRINDLQKKNEQVILNNYGGDIASNWEKGNYKKVIEQGALGLIESLPAMIPAMRLMKLAPVTSMTLGQAYWGGAKYDELRDREDLSEGQKMAIASQQGFIGQGVMYGIAPLFGPLKKALGEVKIPFTKVKIEPIVENEAKAAIGENDIKENLAKVITGIVQKGYSKVAPYTGGLHMGSIMYGQTMADEIIKKLNGGVEEKEWIPFLKEVSSGKGWDAFLNGVIGGTLLHTIPTATSELTKYASSKIKVDAAKQKVSDINNDINNATTPEAQKLLTDAKMQETEAMNNVVHADMEKADKLSAEQQVQLENLSDQIDEVHKALKDENISDASRKLLEDKLKALAAAQDALKPNKEVALNTLPDALQKELKKLGYEENHAFKSEEEATDIYLNQTKFEKPTTTDVKPSGEGVGVHNEEAPQGAVEKISARDLGGHTSEDVMANFAQHFPEHKELMERGIAVTKKLREIDEKAGSKQNPYPFPYKVYSEFINSNKSSPEKKAVAIKALQNEISFAEDNVKNAPSDEELATIKKETTEKEQADSEKRKQVQLSAQEKANSIQGIEVKEKEFIDSISPEHSNLIATMLHEGVPKETIELTKKVSDVFGEVDGEHNFKKSQEIFAKHQYNVENLINTLNTSGKIGDIFNRAKADKAIAGLKEIAATSQDINNTEDGKVKTETKGNQGKDVLKNAPNQNNPEGGNTPSVEKLLTDLGVERVSVKDIFEKPDAHLSEMLHGAMGQYEPAFKEIDKLEKELKKINPKNKEEIKAAKEHILKIKTSVQSAQINFGMELEDKIKERAVELGKNLDEDQVSEVADQMQDGRYMENVFHKMTVQQYLDDILKDHEDSAPKTDKEIANEKKRAKIQAKADRLAKRGGKAGASPMERNLASFTKKVDTDAMAHEDKIILDLFQGLALPDKEKNANNELDKNNVSPGLKRAGIFKEGGREVTDIVNDYINEHDLDNGDGLLKSIQDFIQGYNDNPYRWFKDMEARYNVAPEPELDLEQHISEQVERLSDAQVENLYAELERTYGAFMFDEIPESIIDDIANHLEKELASELPFEGETMVEGHKVIKGAGTPLTNLFEDLFPKEQKELFTQHINNYINEKRTTKVDNGTEKGKNQRSIDEGSKESEGEKNPEIKQSGKEKGLSALDDAFGDMGDLIAEPKVEYKHVSKPEGLTHEDFHAIIDKISNPKEILDYAAQKGLKSISFKEVIPYKSVKGLLTDEQSKDLQKEIEDNYTPKGVVKFGNENKDIRSYMFNFDNPIAQKTSNGVDLRIAEGLIRNKEKTYLLYADGKIVGEFPSVNDAKNTVKIIEDNLVKEIGIVEEARKYDRGATATLKDGVFTLPISDSMREMINAANSIVTKPLSKDEQDAIRAIENGQNVYVQHEMDEEHPYLLQDADDVINAVKIGYGDITIDKEGAKIYRGAVPFKSIIMEPDLFGYEAKGKSDYAKDYEAQLKAVEAEMRLATKEYEGKKSELAKRNASTEDRARILTPLKLRQETVQKEYLKIKGQAEEVKKAERAQQSLFEPENIYNNEDQIKKAHGSREQLEKAIKETVAHIEGHYPIKDVIQQLKLSLAPDRIGDTVFNYITQRSILDTFQEHGYVDLRGAKIHGPQDVADINLIIRNANMENSSVVFVDNKTGEVVHNAVFSLNLPMSTSFPLEQIKEHLEGYKASGHDVSVYAVHNHPSSNPNPSREDIGYTKKITLALGDNFKGHVVIDHTKFTFIKPDGSHKLMDYKNKPPQLFTNRLNLKSDRDVIDPSDVMGLGKVLFSTDGWNKSVMYLDSFGGISKLEIFPDGLTDKQIEDKLRTGLLDNGASRYVVYSRNEDNAAFLHPEMMDIISDDNNGVKSFINNGHENHNTERLLKGDFEIKGFNEPTYEEQAKRNVEPKYTDAQRLKQVAINNGIGVNGYSASNQVGEYIKQSLRKAGLSEYGVKQTSNGNWFITKNGKFFNPRQDENNLVRENGIEYVPNLNTPENIAKAMKVVDVFTSNGVEKFDDIIKAIVEKYGNIKPDFFQLIKNAYSQHLMQSDNEGLTDFAIVKKAKREDYVPKVEQPKGIEDAQKEYDDLMIKRNRLFNKGFKNITPQESELIKQYAKRIDEIQNKFPVKEIQSVEYNKQTGEVKKINYVRNTESGLESDRSRATVENGLGKEDVHTADTGSVEPSIIERTDEDGGGGNTESGSGEFRTNISNVGGEGGNTDLFGGESGVVRRTNTIGNGPSTPNSAQRVNAKEIRPPAAQFAEQVPDELKEKEDKQIQAENIPAILGDEKNIAATLPLLMDGQIEDVVKAEKMLLVDGKKGILFANGTGTGKGLMSLGIAKRMQKLGKGHIVIVVPDQKLITKTQREAKLLGMDVYALDSTKDAGNGGVIATTYANFRENAALHNTNPDLIIFDEAHNILENQKGDVGKTANAMRAITGIGYNAEQAIKESVIGPPPQSMEFYKEYRSEADGNLAWTTYHNLENANRDKIKELAKQRFEKGKVVLLSATPFANEHTLRYADKLLWDMGDENNFYIQNFGYRIRYNKLTKPDADVDRTLMFYQFTDNNVKQGIHNIRMLDVPYDYSRDFLLLDSEVGKKIDEGVRILSDEFKLHDVVRKAHGGIYKAQLSEGIKAKLIIPTIEAHLAAGHKVVVFHSYNQATPVHPFGSVLEMSLNPLADNDAAKRAIEKFRATYPDFENLDLRGLMNPIETFANAPFKDQMVFINGIQPNAKKQNLISMDQFNDDNSGKNVIVVNMAAGATGISLHDMTGKHQRVMINLGLPVRPVFAIQTEGRTYRTGQKSNAQFVYPVIHTDFEKQMFGRIGDRADTAEALALGSTGRNLRDVFVQGYLNPVDTSLYDGRATGGKENDKNTFNLDNYAFAKTLYFGQQKRTARDKSYEGTDYFATPEPLGLKMVEWSDAHTGEKMLEPSAGHGAIARWFPENTYNYFVEPSIALRAKLGLNVAQSNKRIIDNSFEDLSDVNKFDTIVMNPPFGQGGKTAMEHIEKAFAHLRDGGRIVALIPEGGSMEKRFAKWYESEDAKTAYVRSEIRLPETTFKRAGTMVSTKIVIIDKYNTPQEYIAPTEMIDFRNSEDINDLFDNIENMSMTPRIEVEKPVEVQKEIIKAYTPDAKGSHATISTRVAVKNGKTVHVIKFNERQPELVFNDVRDWVTQNKKGWYSKFTKGFETYDEQNAHDIVGQINSRIEQSAVNEPGTPYYKDAQVTLSKDDFNKQLLEDIRNGNIHTNGFSLQTVTSAVKFVKNSIDAGVKTLNQFMKKNNFKLVMKDFWSKVWDAAKNIGKNKPTTSLKSEYDFISLRKYKLFDAQLKQIFDGTKFIDEVKANLDASIATIESLMTNATNKKKFEPIRDGLDYLKGSIQGMTHDQAYQYYRHLVDDQNPKPILYDYRETAWRRFVQQIHWTAYPVRKLQEDIKAAGGKIVDAIDAEMAIELHSGKYKGLLREFKAQVLESHVKDNPSLSQRMLADNMDLVTYGSFLGGEVPTPSFGDYLHAMHAPERNAYVAEIRQKAWDDKMQEAQDMLVNAFTAKEKEQAHALIDQLNANALPGVIKMPDGGSGMTNDESSKIIDALRTQGLLGKYQMYEQQFRNQVLKPMQQVMLDGGLVNQKMVDDWNDRYENYVPLWVDDYMDESGLGGSKGLTGSRDIKAVKGSWKDRVNPYFSSIVKYQRTVKQAEENNAVATFGSLIRQYPNEDLYQIKTPKVEPYLDENGELAYRYKDDQPEPKRAVKFYEDGKMRWIVFNKGTQLYDAFDKFGQGTPDSIVYKALNLFNRWMYSVALKFNPDFFLASNPIKDLQTAMLNVGSELDNGGVLKTAKEIGRHFGPSISAMFKMERGASVHDKYTMYADEYIRHGGMISWGDSLEGKTVTDKIENLQKMMARLDSMSDTWWNEPTVHASQAFKNFAGIIGDVSTAIENATRLATFIAVRENGMSADKAAQVAKNITVNFEKSGLATPYLSPIFWLLKPGINGPVRMLSGLVKSRTVQTAAAILYAGALALALYNMSNCPEGYSTLDEGIKARYLVYMRNCDDKYYVKIPFAWGWNAIKYYGDATAQLINGDKSTSETIGNSAAQTMNAFNPMGTVSDASDMFEQFVPTFGKVPLDIATNKTWYGTHIHPANDDKQYGIVKESHNYWRQHDVTEQWAVDLADYLSKASGARNPMDAGAIEVSPNTLQYAKDQYLGGAGKTVSNIGILAKDIKNGDLGSHMTQYPLVRVFFGQRKIQATTQKMNEMVKASFVHHQTEKDIKQYVYLAKQRILSTGDIKDVSAREDELNRTKSDIRLYMMNVVKESVSEQTNKDFIEINQMIKELKKK